MYRCKWLFLLARPDRFERPTPRFEAWCSIQLSYGRRNSGNFYNSAYFTLCLILL